MSRDYRLYLDDILDSIKNIFEYTKTLSKNDFLADTKTNQAVILNIAIIGEAARNIPADIKSKYPEIDWALIYGMRNILIHKYFSVNLDIVWDVVKKELPALEQQVKKILNNQ